MFCNRVKEFLSQKGTLNLRRQFLLENGMLLTATLGLIVGTPLGFVIHRGSFCMHSGFRQTLGGEPSSSFLAYLLALGCQLLLVNSLAAAHLVVVPVPPLTWLAAIIGGLMFGFGMVWAKG